MLNVNISWLMAFSAGFLSFFTPCILPMIPAYIMYITGESLEDLEGKKAFALWRTLGFVLGFTIIFLIMGTSASFLGQVFVRYKDIISKISGLILIVFGLSMIGVINLKIFNQSGGTKAPRKTKGWLGAVIMGMAFAAGWTPCFGPVLGAILVQAGNMASMSQGVLLLGIYSIGMAVPFILTSLFINIFLKMINKGEKFFAILPKIGGIILVIFGFLVFFDKVINISKFLL